MTSRRVQIAIAILIVVIVIMLYPAKPADRLVCHTADGEVYTAMEEDHFPECATIEAI